MTNIKKFPELLSNQYAVLIIESKTGKILNLQLKYASPKDPLFYIFSSHEEALQFIEVVKSPISTFIIYDYNQNTVDEVSFPSEIKKRDVSGFLKLFLKFKKHL